MSPKEEKLPTDQDLPAQDELDRRKTALEIEALKRKARAEEQQTSLEKLAPSLSQFASITGIIVSTITVLVLILNSWSTKESDELKNFDEVVQSASRKENGPGQRIAGIWLLRNYWGKQKYDGVVANVLSGILAHDADPGVLDACAEVIGLAYDKNTPIPEQERLRKLLYGDLDWNVGALMRVEQIVDSNESAYRLKIHYFGEAVRKNWVNLQSTNFHNAILSNIHLYKADLKNAFLEGADLAGKDTQLFYSDFTNCNLRNANMQFSDARGAIFELANLRGAKLTGANLSPYAENNLLHYTNFEGAHMENVDLQGADLRQARFSRAHLEKANLTHANLDGADFDGAILTSRDALRETVGTSSGKPIFLDNE